MLSPSDLALADAYRDWFQLCLSEAAGLRPLDSDIREAYALIREAQKAVAEPDTVYHATKTEWEAVMRADAITGKPKGRQSHAAPSPQGELL